MHKQQPHCRQIPFTTGALLCSYAVTKKILPVEFQRKKAAQLRRVRALDGPVVLQLNDHRSQVRPKEIPSLDHDADDDRRTLIEKLRLRLIELPRQHCRNQRNVNHHKDDGDQTGEHFPALLRSAGGSVFGSPRQKERIPDLCQTCT